jgi:hypothetical protein
LAFTFVVEWIANNIAHEPRAAVTRANGAHHVLEGELAASDTGGLITGSTSGDFAWTATAVA